AAAAAGATTAGWYFVSNMRCGGTVSSSFNCGFGQVFLGLAVTVVGAAGIILTGWGGHRIFGGKSSVGWSVLGAGLGAVVGLAAMFVFTNATTSNPTVPAWGYVLATAA